MKNDEGDKRECAEAYKPPQILETVRWGMLEEERQKKIDGTYPSRVIS